MKKKVVLGRGLSALIGGEIPQHIIASSGAGGYMLCPVERIKRSRIQPRKTFIDSSLSELADSIKEKGILEPLIVRKDGVDYELIAGERRWRAASIAGLKQVPVIVRDVSDRESLECAIIENIQREDLNPLEEAEAYQSLVVFGLSQEEVAKKVGKDRATVANYLRLLKLPPEVKDELLKGSITMGHARAILSLDKHAKQRELCKKIIEKGLSVRQTERLSAQWLTGVNSPKKNVTRLSSVEDELRRKFGTKVTVRERAGKGRIEIEFFSADERERIIELLRAI